jgi:hypothetical protein
VTWSGADVNEAEETTERRTVPGPLDRRITKNDHERFSVYYHTPACI